MIIAGAGGHSLELLDVLMSTGFNQEVVFYQNIQAKSKIPLGFHVLQGSNDLKGALERNLEFLLGIGKPSLRKEFCHEIGSFGGILKGVKSVHAIVSPYFNWNQDCDIFPKAFISAKVKIGRGTLINTNAQVHHECTIGSFCEISPGAILLGSVNVGNLTSIGAGAIILPNLKVGNNVTIGAGSVVTKNVADNLVVTGVPAKRIDKSNV